MAIEKQLHRLCASAGGQQETALSLLSRILNNLVVPWLHFLFNRSA